MKKPNIYLFSLLSIFALFSLASCSDDEENKEDNSESGGNQDVRSYTKCPDNKHPHAIDLGIGVKWACCNVGASSPEEYGGYYAWGETEEKDYYSVDSYKYYHSHTGYQSIAYDISSTWYDVAHVKWSGGWHMPSDGQIATLIDECTSKWTSINDIYGWKVTGPNGGSIFLPAAGYRYYDYTDDVGSDGYYWSSNQNSYRLAYAYGLVFDSGSMGWNSCGRDYGRSVRPVTE